MKRSLASKLAVKLLLSLAVAAPSGGPTRALRADDVEPLEFNRDIRPLLSDKCFPCHGPDESHREAGLRLDMEEGAKSDRGGYHAIVPGDVESSELMARITSDDEGARMPPVDSGKELSADEIATLRLWIEQGAPWSKHWAYVEPAYRPAPAVKETQWPLNWIDHFILARIEARGLRPAPPADEVTLVRRLYLDIIGLPPTSEQVEHFAKDQRPDAYVRLVDQLLASPRFGERLAMYWLDLVRYADTCGYHGDQDHNIAPYRDYVIDAFNDNLPFDLFTREQLAGDLLPDPTTDQKIASGYNRLLQTSHEGGVQPKEYLSIYAADRVRNVSAVWMGGTLGCAQCHDHKFDPYTAKDFYSMAAFFADIDEAEHFRVGTNELPTKRPPEILVLSRRQRQRLARIESQVAQLKALQQAEPNADEAERLRQRILALQSQQRSINVDKRLTMISVALSEPRVTRILPRGNWLDDSGPIVEPAVPEFLGRLDVSDRRTNRLDLANWLTDPDDGSGGLTARVFANRLWYLFFGHGLSRSLDDFGGQGEPTRHPELLDRLVPFLAGSGWDVKHMVRLLVTSRAYRQASTTTDDVRRADPENRLFARQTRFRLPAELVRDQALAVSGLLVNDFGGMSARPYQPPGYYRHLNFPQREYHHDTGPQQWRRGVYVHWQRQFLHPTFRALDAPSREECTAQRPRSNTPLAALALLNDPTFVEAARVFAQRIMTESPAATAEGRIEFAMLEALSRGPDDFERDQLEALLRSQREYYASHPQAASELLDVGLAAVPTELDSVELAAWTSIARAVLNLHEAMTRR